MAGKLKSIARTVPWFLVLRAGVCAVAWLILPLWAFFVVAILLYSFPLFEPGFMRLPFGILLVVSAFVPKAGWAAALIGISLYCIFGMRQLILVHRRAAYETLVFLILFLVFSRFFSGGYALGNPLRAGALVGIGLAFFLLLKGFFHPFIARMNHGAQGAFRDEVAEPTKAGVTPAKFDTSVGRAILRAIPSLLLIEFGAVVLFLPIGDREQTAFLFLVAAILGEFVGEYAESTLRRGTILACFSLFFVFTLLALAVHPWEL